MAAGRYSLAFSAILALSLCGCLTPVGARGRGLSPARDRERAERLNAEGLALVERGDFPAAGEAFRRALEADPYFGPGHSNLGVVLLQQGQFYEAGWELRWAARLMPLAAAPRANLGILYERIGRWGPAEEELRAALALAPDDVEVLGHLARVHVRQDKHTEETTAWLQAVASHDDHPAWRTWAGQQLTKLGNGTLESRR